MREGTNSEYAILSLNIFFNTYQRLLYTNNSAHGE